MADSIRDQVAEALFQNNFGDDEPHVFASERYEFCEKDADAIMPILSAAITQARIQAWDAAVASIQYEGGQPVEVVLSDNPVPRRREPVMTTSISDRVHAMAAEQYERIQRVKETHLRQALDLVAPPPHPADDTDGLLLDERDGWS